MGFVSDRLRKITARQGIVSSGAAAILFIGSIAGFAYIVNYTFRMNDHALDHRVFEFIAPYINDWNTWILFVFTSLGSTPFLLPANILLALYFLLLKKDKTSFITVVVVSLGTVLINKALKAYFGRIRPADPLLEGVEGFSFPSGHSMSGLAFYGLLMYLVWNSSLRQQIKQLLIPLLALMIALVGFSRIYFRVHYLSDVLAGFAAAVIWLMLSLWIVGRIRRVRGLSLLMAALIPLPLVGGCQKASGTSDPEPVYATAPQLFPLRDGNIDESSGMADSKANPGYLWVVEDSGNPPQIRTVQHDGSVGRSIPLTGAVNRDWEDMALARGPGDNKNYLYIADIGDNNQTHADYSIYRFEEPLLSAASVDQFDKITFSYPDGSHDAEAILVDGVSKDIYIITKRDAKSGVYRLAYPQQTEAANEAVFDLALDYNGVVSAAQSPDGGEIIVKTYTSLYYYTRKAGESIPDVLKRGGTSIAYQLEPQGEAVAFANNNNGFFTLSEKSFAPAVSLQFYKRN
ncbi:MAG TPA: phosphatase PAP2 family protein [Flavitalea sp.]|nr:phosphatase PAP2 family protein [Flavitalea sp.]